MTAPAELKVRPGGAKLPQESSHEIIVSNLPTYYSNAFEPEQLVSRMVAKHGKEFPKASKAKVFENFGQLCA